MLVAGHGRIKNGRNPLASAGCPFLDFISFFATENCGKSQILKRLGGPEDFYTRKVLDLWGGHGPCRSPPPSSAPDDDDDDDDERRI
jgi:hypothetical protein